MTTNEITTELSADTGAELPDGAWNPACAPGCWQYHIECAVKLVRALAAERAARPVFTEHDIAMLAAVNNCSNNWCLTHGYGGPMPPDGTSVETLVARIRSTLES